jgi:hypothetical protein
MTVRLRKKILKKLYKTRLGHGPVKRRDAIARKPGKQVIKKKKRKGIKNHHNVTPQQHTLAARLTLLSFEGIGRRQEKTFYKVLKHRH